MYILLYYRIDFTILVCAVTALLTEGIPSYKRTANIMVAHYASLMKHNNAQCVINAKIEETNFPNPRFHLS